MPTVTFKHLIKAVLHPTLRYWAWGWGMIVVSYTCLRMARVPGWESITFVFIALCAVNLLIPVFLNTMLLSGRWSLPRWTQAVFLWYLLYAAPLGAYISALLPQYMLLMVLPIFGGSFMTFGAMGFWQGALPGTCFAIVFLVLRTALFPEAMQASALYHAFLLLALVSFFIWLGVASRSAKDRVDQIRGLLISTR